MENVKNDWFTMYDEDGETVLFKFRKSHVGAVKRLFGCPNSCEVYASGASFAFVNVNVETVINDIIEGDIVRMRILPKPQPDAYDSESS